MFGDHVEATDFNGQRYWIDIATGRMEDME